APSFVSGPSRSGIHFSAERFRFDDLRAIPDLETSEDVRQRHAVVDDGATVDVVGSPLGVLDEGVHVEAPLVDHARSHVTDDRSACELIRYVQVVCFCILLEVTSHHVTIALAFGMWASRCVDPDYEEGAIPWFAVGFAWRQPDILRDVVRCGCGSLPA